MSYHIMAEVAKKRLARSIDAACERELAAHREQFKKKPAPVIKQPDPRWNAFAPSTYEQLANKSQCQFYNCYAQQNNIGFLGW